MRLTSEKELRLTGLLRSQNRGLENIHSEETRVIRPYGGGGNTLSPLVSAIEAQAYHDKKSNILGFMHAQNVQNNRKIIRPNLSRGRRLPQAPHKNNIWARILSNTPMLHIDRNTGDIEPDNKPWNMRDEFGHAAATPVQGASYVWPNFNYYGNPWGMGGQLYTHLRQGGQQNDRYLYPNKNQPSEAKKKVRFAPLPQTVY